MWPCESNCTCVNIQFLWHACNCVNVSMFYKTSTHSSAHWSGGYQPRSKHRVRGGQCHRYLSPCVSQWWMSGVNLEGSLTLRLPVMSMRMIHWGVQLLCDLMEIAGAGWRGWLGLDQGMDMESTGIWYLLTQVFIQDSERSSRLCYPE